jgi:dTDP-4-dehydrorhamnose 3,5-epimerase-like enzyme
MSLINFVNLPELGDERGQLVAIEENKQIPFTIKRVYYIYGTKTGVARGFHAHKELNQLAVCLSGKCKIVMDNGLNKKSIWLDNPAIGIIIPPMVWHEMHDFSEDCVLLVLASEHYDGSDYIRNYEKFLENVKA